MSLPRFAAVWQGGKRDPLFAGDPLLDQRRAVIRRPVVGHDHLPGVGLLAHVAVYLVQHTPLQVLGLIVTGNDHGNRGRLFSHMLSYR